MITQVDHWPDLRLTKGTPYVALRLTGVSYGVSILSILEKNDHVTGLIIGLHPANERRCYKVMLPLIGRMQTLNQPWCYDGSRHF